MKKLANLNGVKALGRMEQKSINGGHPLAECSTGGGDGCFSGPYYCNIFGLPICSPLDEVY